MATSTSKSKSAKTVRKPARAEKRTSKNSATRSRSTASSNVAANEFAIAESLRGILVEEQDHLIALATALGVDPPDAGVCICYVEQPSSAKIQYAVRD
jgi:bacterioferritin